MLIINRDIKETKSLGSGWPQVCWGGLITNNNGLSYSERLLKLNLKSLEERRLIADLCVCYKIMSSLQHANLRISPAASTVKGGSIRLFVLSASTNLSRNFYSSRVVKLWNSLPERVRSCKSLSSFKYCLLSYDLSEYLVGRALRQAGAAHATLAANK